MENALGCSMGMRSNRYGNGMLAVVEWKSVSTCEGWRREGLEREGEGRGRERGGGGGR